jgi:hypothetical protein
MTAPRFVRPRSPLSPDQIDALVAMRDGGATWREIGRVVCKQDSVCKSIYDRAVRQRVAQDQLAQNRPGREPAAQDEGEAMDKAA